MSDAFDDLKLAEELSKIDAEIEEGIKTMKNNSTTKEKKAPLDEALQQVINEIGKDIAYEFKTANSEENQKALEEMKSIIQTENRKITKRLAQLEANYQEIIKINDQFIDDMQLEGMPDNVRSTFKEIQTRSTVREKADRVFKFGANQAPKDEVIPSEAQDGKIKLGEDHKNSMEIKVKVPKKKGGIKLEKGKEVEIKINNPEAGKKFILNAVVKVGEAEVPVAFEIKYNGCLGGMDAAELEKLVKKKIEEEKIAQENAEKEKEKQAQIKAEQERLAKIKAEQDAIEEAERKKREEEEERKRKYGELIFNQTKYEAKNINKKDPVIEIPIELKNISQIELDGDFKLSLAKGSSEECIFFIDDIEGTSIDVIVPDNEKIPVQEQKKFIVLKLKIKDSQEQTYKVIFDVTDNKDKDRSILKKKPEITIDVKVVEGKAKAERTPENMAILDAINESTEYRNSEKVTDDDVLELLAEHDMDQDATEDAVREMMY